MSTPRPSPPPEGAAPDTARRSRLAPNRRLLLRRAAGLLGAVVLLASVSVAVASGVRRHRAAARRAARIAAVNAAYPAIPSPNFDDRPSPAVNCVVLHATVSESVYGTVRHLSDTGEGSVSAHFIVDKQGNVCRLVPVEKRAWHAGISRFRGREHVNDFSVGIEMMNRNDGKDPYTDAQYRAVAGVIRRLRTCYPIPDSRIVSHAAVALPAGRKSDPAGFDFARLKRLLRPAPPKKKRRKPAAPKAARKTGTSKTAPKKSARNLHKHPADGRRAR